LSWFRHVVSSSLCVLKRVGDAAIRLTAMPRVAAHLAAGAGTRFTGPVHKLLVTLHGVPVWEHSLGHVLAAGFDHVVVVTGAAALPLPAGVTVRHNANWAAGQATSVQHAVAAARDFGATAVTIGLADQPFVTSQAWRAVADAAADCHVVVAEYDGRPGPHPVRLDDHVWPLLPTEGDEGARALLGMHPEWLCRVPCLGSVDDIDTVEDLDRWKSC
jgi:CTP:molybdopterin cytidylyltransferase MocA